MKEMTIQRRTVFAEIHQDVDMLQGGKPPVFSIRYVKKDGTLGAKARCRKTTRRQAGSAGYRGNVKLNHVLLLENLDDVGPRGAQCFEVCIDLITHYNDRRVIHRS